MTYEFQPRGNMWFGNVADVYRGSSWIGGIMQGKHDPRWSAITPSGRGAEPLPFETRDQAAAWLDEQGESVPRSYKWRYDYPWYKLLGPPGMSGLLDELGQRPLLHLAAWGGVAIAGVLAITSMLGAAHREEESRLSMFYVRPNSGGGRR
jgi:hypothetical protein